MATKFNPEDCDNFINGLAPIKMKTKKEIKLDSQLMKLFLCEYYRFDRQIPYVCTEYKFADVIICDEKQMIEIETKISYADLLNEKKTSSKICKHSRYSQDKLPKSTRYFTPNKFYFAFPIDLAKQEKVQNFIEELNPYYGLIGLDAYYSRQLKKFVGQIYHLKQAKLIHSNKPSQKSVELIVKRLSSENIGLREKMYYMNNKIDPSEYK